MSLFRAHQFWSLDLSRLLATDQDQASAASFIACPGQFQAIGSHQVLVCASLGGLLCIVQCPADSQPKEYNHQLDGEQKLSEPIDRAQDGSDHQDEQLICATQLGYPVVDLSCGLFGSALNESIAVLSFDKLFVYQVKRRPPDLISSSPQEEALFGFGLEEQLKVNLQAGCELAAGLLRLPMETDRLDAGDQSSSRPKSRQLPQRDLLLVKYTNQFLVSLVDHKRLVGHFELDDVHQAASTPEAQMGCAMGPQPAAALWHQVSGSVLAIALSDNRIHCVQIDKLMQLAKQRLVQRAAQSLINHGEAARSEQPTTEAAVKTNVDLKLVGQWQFELATGAPVQMEAAGCRERHLLVMSRHQLDMLSGEGQHLWSQRFESSLICSSLYVLPAATADGQDQLMTLLCADCLSSDRCDLLLLRGQQLVWSAQLNSRPIQLWRLQLGQTMGVIGTLDADQSQLSMSYLGTRLQSTDDELQVHRREAANLSQLEQLNQLQPEAKSWPSAETEANSGGLQSNVELEASGQWPEVQVSTKCSFKPSSGSLDAVMGLNLIMIFDEMLAFESSAEQQFIWLSAGCLCFKLGNCWPDQVEPLQVEGRFSLRDQQVSASSLPKSLHVKLVAIFSQQSGGNRVQEDGFLLPLTLITKLRNVDYSSGQDQTLDDVMSNLMGDPIKHDQWFASDILLWTEHDLLDLVDEFIEGDLVCRGLEPRVASFAEASSEPEESLRRLVKNTAVAEKISLLAQSLDCRLRYKSINRLADASALRQQASDDPRDIVLVSFGLDMASGSSPLDDQARGWHNPDWDLTPGRTTLWLHLCDLTADSAGSPMAEELLRRRHGDWVATGSGAHKSDCEPARPGRPVLFAVDSESSPMAVLFMQNHLVKRFGRHAPMIRPLEECAKEAIKRANFRLPADSQEETRRLCDGVVTMNDNLNHAMRLIVSNYDTQIAGQIINLKRELKREYCKFYVSTISLLSLAKKLVNLPNERASQFRSLSALVKSYHNNQIGILMELERLKRLEREFHKLPETEELLAPCAVGKNPDRPFRWPISL